ncbi:MAG: zeta toxin family protein, partial [Chitinophagaceae bacterium]
SFRTEERESLHEDIVNSMLGSKNFSRNRSAYILGGAPANGKSTFLNSSYCGYPASALKIDPDEIKKMLPEYTYMVETEESLAAAIVHEESSFVAKKIRKGAIASGIDIILDGIADGTLQNRIDEYKKFKDGGYYVRMDYVSLGTGLSLALAKKRAEETGREVPEDFVKDMNRIISGLVPEMVDNHCFDELFLWDTNEEAVPRLVIQYKNGKLEVKSHELYESFKKKKNE